MDISFLKGRSSTRTLGMLLLQIISRKVSNDRSLLSFHLIMQLLSIHTQFHYQRFMLNDPNVWGDPKSFRPERFLRAHNPVVDSLPDPSHVIFGFGTRSAIFLVASLVIPMTFATHVVDNFVQNMCRQSLSRSSRVPSGCCDNGAVQDPPFGRKTSSPPRHNSVCRQCHPVSTLSIQYRYCTQQSSFILDCRSGSNVGSYLAGQKPKISCLLLPWTGSTDHL